MNSRLLLSPQQPIGGIAPRYRWSRSRAWSAARGHLRSSSFDRETLAAAKAQIDQSFRDADSYRASVEQRHVLLNPGPAPVRRRAVPGSAVWVTVFRATSN
jgi:hypothetical protein